MILGIGTDIIEIKRIAEAVKKESFLNRYFTPKEIVRYQQLKHSAPTIAADFAAKEAVAKAIGTGFRGFSAADIQLSRDEEGKPMVAVLGACAEVCHAKGILRFHVSLSHTRELATAFVIGEGKLF